MGILGTYVPDEVSLIAVGIPITGFAPGTFISVEQNEDAFSLQVGSSGEACRTRTNNLSSRITFTLLQSSNDNLLLSAVFNSDQLSPAGDGILPTLIKDNSGTTVIGAEKSWIVRMPTVEFANEGGTREWVIETDRINAVVGGN
jgi:hypothetical protein